MEKGDRVEKKLYVGNISYRTTEDELRELFSQCGEVVSVKLITDAHTGNAKGFGFVEMATEEAAQKAVAELNATMFGERTITVAEAKPQQPRERRGFGGGGGRGGFGGGGGRGGFGGGGGRGGFGGGRGRGR
jgi:RNA recognition motif-containing protein